MLAGVAAASVWACGDSPAAPPTPEPARPTTVTVSPATAELTALGTTVQLAAEVHDQNDRLMAGATVSWTSGAGSVATVSASGLVTAVAEGVATITASAGGASGRATVTVAQAPDSVAVSPAAVTITALGDTLRLAAQAFDTNGHAAAVAEFSWESSADSVATVSASGLVTAVAEGVATITASAGGASGRATVTVAQAPDSVAVSPAAVTITALGDTLRLAAQAFDTNGHAAAVAEFSWESSADSVATVSASGLVTAVAEGVATITASAGEASGSAVVTVAQVVNLDRAALVALYKATDGPNWVNSENWLTDEPLEEWYGVETDGLGRATRLNLNENGLTGVVPPLTRNLTRLTHLELRRNNLSGPIPPELGQLGSLERLHLNANNLSGPIPPELGHLGSLEQLGLVANDLSGPIPRELGQLANLELLFLYANDLSGPIPPELGQLRSLVSLDLEGNDLSGPIPPELGNLTRLKTLQLGSNDLSGPIPQELRNLRGLESISLAGNPGICPPEDPEFVAWLLERGGLLYRCDDVRRLPGAQLREDGNGISLALPDDLRASMAVRVSDPTVVAAAVVEGWLELSPRGRGSAEVEVVPSGGGSPAITEVVVRAAVGTFGIDIFVEEPAPVGFGQAMAKAADWWSYSLDGTEWEDRPSGCPSLDHFHGKAKALADELLIGARIEEQRGIAGYADGCFFPIVADGVPALDPGGGYVVASPGAAGSARLLRHEIGHLLGLVLWPPETGLKTADLRYFTGPRAVEEFRAQGGNPDLPGVPLQDTSHWHLRLVDDVLGGGDGNLISLAALVDAGYTADLSRAQPGHFPQKATEQAARPEFARDTQRGTPRVFVESRPRSRRPR